MEITTDFLNAIAGRPDILQPWKKQNGEGWWLANSISGEQFAIKIDEGKCSLVFVADLAPKVALELATYARRVEIEIERAKSEPQYFIGGFPMASRSDAIDNAFDDAELHNQGPIVDVGIECGTPFYADERFDADAALNAIEQNIRQEAGTGECGAPEFEWRDGAVDGLRAFVREYAKLQPWYLLDSEEIVRLRVLRDEDGNVDGWEEIKESEVANADAI